MREDDIFVVSFPKCGTTLTMELCWLVKISPLGFEIKMLLNVTIP